LKNWHVSILFFFQGFYGCKSGKNVFYIFGWRFSFDEQIFRIYPQSRIFDRNVFLQFLEEIIWCSYDGFPCQDVSGNIHDFNIWGLISLGNFSLEY
jgi:hypothetical protein